jgi:hypothetical protein
MKDFILASVNFTTGVAGVSTIRLDIENFDVRRLVAIINQTRGVLLYASASESLRYTALNENTLTLNVDTSSHSPSDLIQIVYNSDDAIAVKTSQSSVLEASLIPLLKNVLNFLAYPNWLDRTLNALRISVISGIINTITTVTGVTTVSTVTNQTNIGSYAADVQVDANRRAAWAMQVRGRIT